MAPPKVVLLTAFFDQLGSLLKELSAMYPDDPDFPLASTTLRMLKTTSPAFVLKQFADASVGFEAQILAKDETFFLGHTFAELEDVDFNVLAKLKQYVQAMSPDSKDAVWTYIQNLHKLVKAYYA
jgi:hypothetical protein